MAGNISADIVVYRGRREDPKWIDNESSTSYLSRQPQFLHTKIKSENFSTLCTVRADTSQIIKKKHDGPKGTYYTQEYDIVLSCGLTELKARLCWKNNKVRSAFCLECCCIDVVVGTRKMVFSLNSICVRFSDDYSRGPATIVYEDEGALP